MAALLNAEEDLADSDDCVMDSDVSTDDEENVMNVFWVVPHVVW
jgi:hypothetical protein